MKYQEKNFNLSTFHYKAEMEKVIFTRTNDLIDALKPFIGQKIRLANGELSAKVNKVLPKTVYEVKPLNFGDSAKVHYDLLNSFLRVEFSICFNGGKYGDNTYYCHYENDRAIIGIIKNGILISLNKKKQKPVTIDIMEQAKLISEYNQKLKELGELSDKILI